MMKELELNKSIKIDIPVDLRQFLNLLLQEIFLVLDLLHISLILKIMILLM